MIYAFLDTNIYNRILTQSQPGYEIELFESLKSLTAESKVSIIVPEVVCLEFTKFYNKLLQDFNEKFNVMKSAVKDAFTKKEIWNELDDVKQEVDSLLKNIEDKKPKFFKDRCTIIQPWLDSNDVKFVPFTTSIWLSGKKRLISGKMPNPTRTSDQDSCIIESILTVLKSDNDLFFCSTNTNDFAVELEGGDFALHPILLESMPRTFFFSDLQTMVKA